MKTKKINKTPINKGKSTPKIYPPMPSALSMFFSHSSPTHLLIHPIQHPFQTKKPKQRMNKSLNDRRGKKHLIREFSLITITSASSFFSGGWRRLLLTRTSFIFITISSKINGAEEIYEINKAAEIPPNPPPSLHALQDASWVRIIHSRRKEWNEGVDLEGEKTGERSGCGYDVR